MREKFTEQFHRLLRPQRGAIMVFFVILVPVLFGFMGLAIDFGLAYVQKGKLQDIADATALAAAAHLHDGEGRMDAIKESVDKYAQANGLKGFDLLYKESESAWDAQEQPSAIGRYSVAYGIVMVTKDGVERERVRVRIAERVPTFFLRALGEEFKSGMLVAAKAAAEGGTVTVITNETTGGPKLWMGPLSQSYKSADSIVLADNFDFSIYVSSSGVDPYKLPGTGSIFANNLYNTWSANQQYEYRDYTTQVFVPPLPEGRYFYPDNGWSVWYHDAQPEIDDRDAAIIAEMNAKYTTLLNNINASVSSVKSDKQAYIDGVDAYGNDNKKRYIGYDANGNLINTIKDTDTEIDLYMESTYCANWINSNMCLLTNAELKNVKKVDNVYFMDKWAGVIATEGITYGNVFGGYTNGSTAVYLAGSNNVFEKLVYASGEMKVGGYDNRYLCRNNADLELGGLFCYNTMYLGQSYKVTESYTDNIYNMYQGINYLLDVQEYNYGDEDSWRVYFGEETPSGSSGTNGNDTGNGTDSDNTTGSGTTTIGGKTHLRLVE